MKEKEGCCEMVLPIGTKEKENKGVKKNELRSFWCSKEKIREINCEGYVYAKGNSELMTHLTTFSFLKFTHHPL